MEPYYLLSVISALIFFHGFFPITTTIKEFNNEPPTSINNISLRVEEVYITNITKTVIVVIDALRLDFVNLNFMPLTSKIIAQHGCFNQIKVETPTVTLPRIKALTAGNIPQFIDLILNLASTEILKDSLIHSAHKKGQRIVFYGDDTWLKLFPNYFTRYEGTNSFFVKDFTEVDDNVTRNVNIELNREDWDIMILHYLGLDHIGHVYGPFSSLVPKKLQEMDTVIHKIYTSMLKTNENTLIAITGDHGMRDSGGHGGSTYSETNVPLLVIGIDCQNGSFPQTDIPINLAILLGLNIPATAIGQIRSNILPFNLEKYLYVLRYNTLLLKQKTSGYEDIFNLATTFHERFLMNFDETSAFKAIELYKNCSEVISHNLINSSIQQNVIYLVIAILMIMNILLLLIFEFFMPNFTRNKIITYLIYFSPLVNFAFLFRSVFIIHILLLFVLLMINIVSMLKLKCNGIPLNTTAFLILFSLVHPVTFFSSSFVEEEHQYWYFFNILFTIGYLVDLSTHNKRKSIVQCLLLLVSLRFLRTVNSTGDKWANYPDVADWLLKSCNFYYYELFFILGLLILFYSQYLLCQKALSVHIADAIILSLIFIFKNFDSFITLGQIIWLLIISHFIIFYKNYKVFTWTLISVLLLKPYNTILVGYCIFSSILFSKWLKRTETITLYHIWLGNMLYFAQGHSNSLASVDISVGYIGLNHYQPFFVILQVLLHTYTFPVLCHALILRNKFISKTKAWNIIFCNHLYNLFIICIITFIQRHHLFIWSVFAPKLFIECVHIIFLFVEYCCYIFIEKLNFILKAAAVNKF